MAQLFDVNVLAISKQLDNSFSDQELEYSSTVSKMEIVQKEGKVKRDNKKLLIISEKWYIIDKEMIQMKPLEKLNFDEKEVVHLQSIEEKLTEAEKALEDGKTYAEEDVWKMFSKKYGFDL